MVVQALATISTSEPGERRDEEMKDLCPPFKHTSAKSYTTPLLISY